MYVILDWVPNHTGWDHVWIKEHPEFYTEFIYATYILERTEDAGTLIVNKPQSLRDANEKLFTSWFAEHTQ